MKTIEQAAKDYSEECYLYNDAMRMQAETHFEAGIEFAQRWISVEEGLPICYESGDWDGLRSEFVLVNNKNGAWGKGRLYSGVIDGSKYSDWYDEYDYLGNITHWRPIELK